MYRVPVPTLYTQLAQDDDKAYSLRKVGLVGLQCYTTAGAKIKCTSFLKADTQRYFHLEKISLQAASYQDEGVAS